MPLLAPIIAFFIRQLILIGVQLGIFWAIDTYITPLLNSTIKSIVTNAGVSEEDAAAFLHNEILTTAESLGLTVALSRAKLPLTVADKLGFKTSGMKPRKLSPQGEQKLAPLKGKSKTAAVSSQEAVSSIAKTVSQSRGVSLERASQVAQLIVAGFGVPIGVGLLITNTIDFAAWNSSAYQGTFQRVFAVMGLTPDRSMPDSKILSTEVWDKVYNVYKESGAVGIEDPFKNQTVLFSRQALIDLVDKTASGILLESGTASAKQVIGATTQMVILKPPAGMFSTAPVSGGTSTGGGSSSGTRAVPQQIQVYTGIVASGALGTPSEFVARPDDMIQNTDELRAAAKNNLAAFVQGLPGRFFYEIGIVNSVKSPAGFTVKGEPVKIISSYTSSGTPRYKTVYNKFAVMRIAVRNENGTNVKLATITLGPVNVVDFQPTNQQLTDLAGTITGELFTSDIGDIKQINSPNPVTVNNDPVSPPPPPTNAPVQGQPTPIAGQQYIVSTGGINLNLRDAPSLQGTIIAKIPNGTVLGLDPNSGDTSADGFTWHKTTYQGTIGYIAREYIVAYYNNARDIPAAGIQILAEDNAPSGARVERVDGKLFMYPPEPVSTSSKDDTSGNAPKQPKVKLDSLGLTTKQRQVYDQLRAAGFPKSNSLTAAKLVNK